MYTYNQRARISSITKCAEQHRTRAGLESRTQTLGRKTDHLLLEVKFK